MDGRASSPWEPDPGMNGFLNTSILLRLVENFLVDFCVCSICLCYHFEYITLDSRKLIQKRKHMQVDGCFICRKRPTNRELDTQTVTDRVGWGGGGRHRDREIMNV